MNRDYKTPAGTAPPDWRGLCEELADALDGWHKAVFETGMGWVRPDETYLLDRARAALATGSVAEPLAGAKDCDGRDPECVKRWPDCFDGGYHPSCCRFPKSCSCGPRALPLPQGEVE